jgi:hypothetical protein
MSEQATTNKRYFVSPLVDFIFIGGSSFVLFACLLMFYTDVRTPTIVTTAVVLSWIINWPHFSMSTYRLYQSQTNTKQYPITSFVIPFVILGGIVLCYSFPDLVAPYFVKLFILWSPYHFSGQTIGITFIYCMRSGIKLTTFERRLIMWFVLGTYFVSTIRAETSREGFNFYGVQYPSMQIPYWMSKYAEYAMWAIVAAFVVWIIYWSYRNKKILPWIVILPAATQYLWFMQTVYMPSFQEFVPMLHSLQYILIAWGIQLKVKMETKQIEPSKKYVISETSRWFVINLIGGVILFYMLPKIGTTMGYTSLFSIAIVYAAIQIHHFFVDGVIWKLKNQTVSHPLMMTYDELTTPRAPPSRSNELTV